MRLSASDRLKLAALVTGDCRNSEWRALNKPMVMENLLDDFADLEQQLAAERERGDVAGKMLTLLAHCADGRSVNGCDGCPATNLAQDEEDPDECSCGLSMLIWAKREANAALGLAAGAGDDGKEGE